MNTSWEKIINEGNINIIYDQKIASKFDKLVSSSLESSIKNLINKSTFEKIIYDKDGFTALHKYIDPTLRTKIQDSVSAKIKIPMLKLTTELAHKCLSFLQITMIS